MALVGLQTLFLNDVCQRKIILYVLINNFFLKPVAEVINSSVSHKKFSTAVLRKVVGKRPTARDNPERLCG